MSHLDEPAGQNHKLEEIRKLVKCAEQFHPFHLPKRSIGSLDIEYLNALIAARRFDDVFERLKKEHFFATEFLTKYCEAKLLAGEPENLPEQLNDIASIHEAEFADSTFEMSKIKVDFSEKARILSLLKSGRHQEGIDQVLSHTDVSNPSDYRFPYRFWIRAIFVTCGEDVSNSLIEQLLAKVTDEDWKANAKTEFESFSKPQRSYTAIRPKLHGSRAKLESEKRFDKFCDKAKMPISDWLVEAVRMLYGKHVPKELQMQYVAEIREGLKKPGLTKYELKHVIYNLSRHHEREGDWAQVCEIAQKYPPGASRIFSHGQLCLAAEQQQVEQLDSLVSLLPDASGLHGYSTKLLDLLVRQGDLDKAERNVDSLGKPVAVRYRKKLRFHRLLKKTNFDDLPAYASAYASFYDDEEHESKFYTFYFHDLGTDHLADIAVKNHPAAALRLARAVPHDDFYNDQNQLGICLSVLLKGKQFELAAKIGNFATADEKAKARLDIKEVKRFIPVATWKRLGDAAPNDPLVIATLLKMAIEDGNQDRALELAKRGLLQHGGLAYRSAEKFCVDARWHWELLRVAGDIQKENPEDPKLKQLRRNVASRIGNHIPFANADEAIQYARKYLRRGKPGANFLLSLAQEWAKEL